MTLYNVSLFLECPSIFKAPVTKKKAEKEEYEQSVIKAVS